MLNDIRLHLDSDEASQSAHELAVSGSIHSLQSANINAFKQYIPSISEILPKLPFERLSIFVDQDEQTNIVDFNTGKTLYPPAPDAHIACQVNAYAYHSALLDLFPNAVKTAHTDSKAVTGFAHDKKRAEELHQDLQQQSADTLVVLGLGKATQLGHLFDCSLKGSANRISQNKDECHLNFEHKDIKHLVVYEPDWEMFRCSLDTFDWAGFLENAQQRQLQIFLQVGNDLSRLHEDIHELQTQLGANRIVFYKHLNLPIYATIINNIRHGKWGKSVSETKAIDEHQNHFLHIFGAIEANNWTCVDNTEEMFVKNMALFEKFYPDIHQAFKQYKGQAWDTIKHKDNAQINLYNRQFCNYFSTNSPIQEAQALARHFTQYPNLDGLVFGHSGDKLKHYAHNTFIRQSDMILRSADEEKSELPKNVKCLLVFGLGSGYQLSEVCRQHNVQHLVICEPNPDMFYASLHAIDWQDIFDNVEKNDFRLYINIGEASSRLFRDLMTQFLQMGPHVLNQTYIMQAYQNPVLDQVLTEVRQQLRVIFSMGENFDHVAYGLAHTAGALYNKVPALRHQPSQYLSHQNKQTPVFLIGNGPSLDDSIDIIKECRDSVIVVSCGTALQALYKNGITPDFHGEVEQNRANYDWASRINDKAYLKEITLISVNGIHPDTYGLYKNVMFAFKAGESSTQATLAALPKDSYHVLDHAYPTVTNMAMSFFMALGFEQLYLVGVDLGFVDQDKHHSSSSGYYENGKQLYDYKSVHAADLRVRGNRSDWVFTKTEFNISRMIIEQLIRDPKASPSKHLECFNLSNGVFIDGTIPLDPEAVLVMTSAAERTSTLQSLDNCFMSLNSDIYKIMKQAYNDELLSEQLSALKSLSETKLKSKKSVQKLVHAYSETLLEARAKGHSLFYYYFFNSIHFLTAALNKASLQSNSAKAVKDCNKIMDCWRIFLSDALAFTQHNKDLIDTAEAFSDKREKLLLSQKEAVAFMSLNPHINAQAIKWKRNTGKTQFQIVQNIDDTQAILLIDIYTQVELAEFQALLTDSKRWQQRTAGDLNIGFVFHELALMQRFAKANKTLAAECCLIYCPECLETLENTSPAVFGEQPVLTWEQYFLYLQSRAQSINEFSIVIAKPRFCETGANRAIPKSRGANNKNCTSQSETLASKAHAQDKDYDSFAIRRVENDIVKYLPDRPAYMFKHYLAYPKAISAKHKSVERALSVTILDGIENRGLLVTRPLQAHELLGQWQSEDFAK